MYKQTAPNTFTAFHNVSYRIIHLQALGNDCKLGIIGTDHYFSTCQDHNISTNFNT